MVTRLHIVTANVYTANKREDAAEQALERRKADVILTQESHWIARLSGYRLSRASQPPGTDRHSTQNAVHVLARHPYEGHGAYRVTDELEGDKFAPDRWITWERFLAHGHPVCAISTHVNAVLQNKDGTMRKGPRIDQARLHMLALGREIQRQQRDGFDVVVGLDANYANKGQRLWRHSPHRTFPRAGLRYVPRHIDGIALPKVAKVHGAGSFDVPGSDHRGFELTAEIPKLVAR